MIVEIHKIDAGFSKLTTELRTDTSTPTELEYSKDKTSFSDVLDCFLQLSLVLQNKGELSLTYSSSVLMRFNSCSVVICICIKKTFWRQGSCSIYDGNGSSCNL